MAQSMTGYGRGNEVRGGCDILVEVKSVNSRYFEYSSRLPRRCAFLEAPLKKALSAEISRGKVEVQLTMQNLEKGDTKVAANLQVARGYFEAMAEICDDLRINNDVSANTFARFSDVFTLVRTETDEEALCADVLAVAGQAIEHFNTMRKTEGEKLAEDILNRLDSIEKLICEVEKDSAARVKKYTVKLKERIADLLADANIDEARILTEAAIFADKTAVDEETVRLRSHLKQFREILAQAGPVGRKLDFLTQEVNRETNTIGSKCQDLEITRLVVDLKAEVEKIREQIQNLE